MIHFENDYSEGAHPRILEILGESNHIQSQGYGQDEFCQEAGKLVKDACEDPTLSVYFLSGGTQVNATLISHALRNYEAVLASDTAHIYDHETGAIEAQGHKIIPLPNKEGLLPAEEVKNYMDYYSGLADNNHLPLPKMVFLSNSSEYGTIYKKADLQALRQVCDQYELYLYLDGARLGYALASKENDLSLADIASLTDVFYFGGTKIGAMFGEALVIKNESLKAHIEKTIKQKGGLLAKGRFLGLQFQALFENELYLDLGQHANSLAERIRQTLIDLGIDLYIDSPTNQLFPIFHEENLKILEEDFIFSPWKDLEDGREVVRVCTSWATKEENVDLLIKKLQELGQ